VQDIDLATGGDGEFRWSSYPGETVDLAVMKQRIIDRAITTPTPAADGDILRRALHILETTGISYFVNKRQGRPNWEATRDEVMVVCAGLRAALGED
jgi:hypothetical protein